jgi:hypothetical protein
MRLASITLPFDRYNVPKGIRLDRGHEEIRNYLLSEYKGYTRIVANGAWVAPDGTLYYEDVYRYEFAAEWAHDGDPCFEALRALASRVKVLTGEQSIMIVHINGRVEFI